MTVANQLFHYDYIVNTEREEKVFYAIDDLINYIDSVYGPAENKLLSGINGAPRDLMIKQITPDDQKFYTRSRPWPFEEDHKCVMTVKVPLHQYDDSERHVGMVIEQFFVDRPKCLNSLKD